MKKLFLLLLTGILIYACSPQKTITNSNNQESKSIRDKRVMHTPSDAATNMFDHSSDKNTKYYMEDKIEIGKSDYQTLLKKGNYLDIHDVSANYHILASRVDEGQIKNRTLLEEQLESSLGIEIDTDKALVIIYYPGKDRCNSSGIKEVPSITNWRNRLEAGLDKVANVKPIYICRSFDGLKPYKGIVKWHKDPNGIIKDTFFEYHYPCHSFVVINNNGEYISTRSKFAVDEVWEATDFLVNQQ